MQNDQSEIPSEILKECWKNIQEGIQSRKSNYHTMSLHYLGDNTPRSTIMIPRKINLDQCILYTHTDYRSPKITHLKKRPKVCILFWCKEKKTQLVIEATCQVLHKTDQNKDTWHNMQNMSKVCYAADIAPSTNTPKLSTGFTEKQWINRNKIALSSYAYDNFAILALHIQQIERLHLCVTGHTKIVFTKDGSEKIIKWNPMWKSP